MYKFVFSFSVLLTGYIRPKQRLRFKIKLILISRLTVKIYEMSGMIVAVRNNLRATFSKNQAKFQFRGSSCKIDFFRICK